MQVDDSSKKVIAKIEAGKKLTRNENILYFTQIMGYTKNEAVQIMNITQNKRPEVIINS